MEFDNVTTVQIIFNMFRQRPSELFFDLTQQKNIGILARVPLASGLPRESSLRIPNLVKTTTGSLTETERLLIKAKRFQGLIMKQG